MCSTVKDDTNLRRNTGNKGNKGRRDGGEQSASTDHKRIQKRSQHRQTSHFKAVFDMLYNKRRQESSRSKILESKGE